MSYDSNMIAQYAAATSADNEPPKAFYRQTLVRAGLVATLDQREAQIAAGQAPTNLLQDEDSIDGRMQPYQDALARGEVITAASGEAGDNADACVLTTLLLASALFFAGPTTSFRVRFARLVLLAASSVTIADAAARLIELPMA